MDKTSLLAHRLKQIYDDADFITGVLFYVEHPDDLEDMINFLNECEKLGDTISDEHILLYALQLHQERNP